MIGGGELSQVGMEVELLAELMIGLMIRLME